MELYKRRHLQSTACLCEKPLDRDLENIEKLRTALKEVAKTRPLPYMAVGFPKCVTYTHGSTRKV
jgi:hypothetical protein